MKVNNMSFVNMKFGNKVTKNGKLLYGNKVNLRNYFLE